MHDRQRGQFVEITEAGRELQKKMWSAYRRRSKSSGSNCGHRCHEACGLLDGWVLLLRRQGGRCPRRRAGAMTALICLFVRTTPSAFLGHKARSVESPDIRFFMARDQIDMTPLPSRDELVTWFEAASSRRPSSHRYRARENPVHAEAVSPCHTKARAASARCSKHAALLGWGADMERGNIIGSTT